MDIHVYLHSVDSVDLKARLDRIDHSLSGLHEKANTIMAEFTALQAAVTKESTVIDSAIVLLNGLAQKIADLAPNQAAIDALAAEVSAETAKLATAVATGTPNPPAPPTVAVVTPT